jgi:hypothetical protein
MEKFKGICFLTSNYAADKMDASFSRRILFQVALQPPDTNVMVSIWKNKIKLSDVHIKYLVSNYSLTGAQIDNVVKKITMDLVLEPKIDVFKKAKEYCAKELGQNSKGKSNMGFKI